MKKHFLILLAIMMTVSSLHAQKKLELTTINFTENPDQLLKGIPFEKTPRDHYVQYKIKDTKQATFAGNVPEFSVELGAQNNKVISYYAATEKTATTNKLLAAIMAKYHQPTTKVKDNGDIKAYYWETPTLFIRFMTSEVGSAKSIQVASFVHIATLASLKSGAEPDLNDVYKLLQNMKH